MDAVWQEPGENANDSLGAFHQRGRRATGGRHATETPVSSRNHDDVIRTPRTARHDIPHPGTGRLTYRDGRASGRIDPFEFSVNKEANQTAVRRPEGRHASFRSRKRLRRERVKTPNPDLKAS